MSVPYHAWTHRPRSQGGTDPVDINLPWINAWYDGSTQTVTSASAVELRLDSHQTFAPDTFALDTASTTNPSGILIYQRGIYAICAFVAGASSQHGIYVQTQPASSYPLFGAEDDPATSANGTPFLINQERWDDTNNTLSAIYIRKMFPTLGAPWRTILAGSVPTGQPDYSVTLSSLTIIRIGKF